LVLTSAKFIFIDKLLPKLRQEKRKVCMQHAVVVVVVVVVVLLIEVLL
jgi:hypothetical protein